MRTFLWLITVAALALAAVLFAMVRPGQRRSAMGLIVSKTFKNAGTYMQSPSGVDRGFRSATPIEIAESYVLEVRVEGESQLVRGSLNTIAARSFETGQHVRIEYETRGLPFFGRRLLFTDIQRADE